MLNGVARLKVLRINLEAGKLYFRPDILRSLNYTGGIGSYPASPPFVASSEAGERSFPQEEGKIVARAGSE